MEKIQVTKDRYRSYRFHGVTRSIFTPSKNSLEYYFAITKTELRDSLFPRVKGKVGNMCWPHCTVQLIFGFVFANTKRKVSHDTAQLS